MTITPTDEQNNAIKAILAWYQAIKPQEFYLAGYAGVGKSTIVELVVAELKAKYKIKKVCMAAYTGKAASVLRSKGNPDAQTIHGLIYKAKTDKKTGELKRFVLSHDSDIADADLVILDECSMVDEKTRNDLLSFGKKILIMGDPGQLPPVNGQGAFTNREPDFFLREIHRQAADSPILELATMARLGQRLPIDYAKGNVMVTPLRNNTADLIHAPDTQVLCGVNQVRWTITQRMRAHLLFEGNRPLKGERIICCKNNHERGIFNGTMGKLDSFKACKEVPNAMEISFSIDDEEETAKSLITDPYLFDNHFKKGSAKKIEWVKGYPRFNEFDWAYAVTVHKAQGSSWKHATVIDDSISFRENQSKWLYTAITRAETGLTLLTR